MKKRFRLIAIILGAIIAISGCGKGSDNQEKNTLENSNQSVTTDEGKTETEASDTDEKMKILTGNTYLSYDTEDGRYYISEDDESLIRYVDYTARKEVYLCNKLNCKHNNKNCTAVLPEGFAGAEYALFGDGESVYILSTPYDSAGSMSVVSSDIEVEGGEGIIMSEYESTEPPRIYRMDKDGTNREKVFEFESGVIAEPEVILGDGNCMYIVTKRIDSDTEGNTTYTSGYDRKLVKVDLKNGTSETVTDLKNEYNIIGCSGRNLIVSEDDFGREVSNKELHDDNKYKELYDKSKYVISSINVDDKKKTELKTIKNSSDKLHMEKVCNDKLYISYEKENFIEIIDLVSGEVRKLDVNDSYSIEDIISVKDAADTIVGMPYSNIGNEKGWSHYLINTETGKVTKSTLQTRYKNPITIEAQNEEYLYVMNDYRNETEYVAWAGVDQEYIAEEEYSIISKKDYLANKANYKKVEMINGGE